MTPLVLVAVCAARLSGTYAMTSVVEGAYDLLDTPAPLLQTSCPDAPPPLPDAGIVCSCGAGYDCKAWFIQVGVYSLGTCERQLPLPSNDLARTSRQKHR